VSQTICDAIGEGISLEGAAEFANVSPSTAYEWLSRGLGEDPRGREQTKVAEDGARNRRVEPEQTPEKGMRFAGGPGRGEERDRVQVVLSGHGWGQELISE